MGYGIGWQTFEDDNGFVSLGHSGGMPGVATVLRIYPGADAVVVVLMNAGVNDAAGRISDIRADVAVFTGGSPQADDLTLLILRYLPD